MTKADLKRLLKERLKGWRLMPDGERIAYLDFYESAVFPMAGMLAVAVRFDGRRNGQTGMVVEQLQFGLSPQQCRALAEQLLAGAKAVENDALTPDGKPN